jgi:2-oxoglutarate ferredoxin oxidoreductase subunit delta
MKYWRTPLDVDRVRIPSGEVHIIRERCKGCSFCVEYCPKNILKLSEEFNEKGYHPPIVTEAENCVHCQLCEMLCPEFAIYVILIEEKEPIYAS